jgi:hypothetical protein
MCIYYASHEGMTFTHEEYHLAKWSKPKRGRLILK